MKKLLSMLLLVTALGGCASSRMDRLEVTTHAFDNAMRWSDFGTALSFINPNVPMTVSPQHLNNIRITSYEKLGVPAVNEDGTKMMQRVEIRFVRVESMSERQLFDEQRWEFADSRWRLQSPFPNFR